MNSVSGYSQAQSQFNWGMSHLAGFVVSLGVCSFLRCLSTQDTLCHWWLAGCHSLWHQWTVWRHSRCPPWSVATVSPCCIPECHQPPLWQLTGPWAKTLCGSVTVVRVWEMGLTLIIVWRQQVTFDRCSACCLTVCSQVLVRDLGGSNHVTQLQTEHFLTIQEAHQD